MCDKTEESEEDETERTGEVRGCIIYSRLNESTLSNCLVAADVMKTKRDFMCTATHRAVWQMN